ncbi:MAG TPA: preprotein translocase subunit SecG [Candidatus Omnitrophota bacterium]|nr:preprotein translocase subunit SecG [Candidatus Omnitrophota bacterium]
MTTFLIIIHVFACVVLIVLVLIQRGRGAGLVESFSGVESMFGTKTNVFLTRITTIMSVVFFITCLALAALSVRQSKSLISQSRSVKPKVGAVKPEATKPEAAKPEAAKPQITEVPVAQTVQPAQTAKPDAAKVQ